MAAVLVSTIHLLNIIKRVTQRMSEPNPPALLMTGGSVISLFTNVPQGPQGRHLAHRCDNLQRQARRLKRGVIAAGQETTRQSRLLDNV